MTNLQIYFPSLFISISHTTEARVPPCLRTPIPGGPSEPVSMQPLPPPLDIISVWIYWHAHAISIVCLLYTDISLTAITRWKRLILPEMVFTGYITGFVCRDLIGLGSVGFRGPSRDILCLFVGTHYTKDVRLPLHVPIQWSYLAAMKYTVHKPHKVQNPCPAQVLTTP